MISMKLMWLQNKVTWGWGLLLPSGVLIVYSLLTVQSKLSWYPGEELTPLLLPLFEAIAALIGVFMLPRLIAGEVETNRLELLLSLPRRRWLHLATGILGVFAAIALGLLMLGVYYHFVHLPVDFAYLFKYSIPPILATGGLALAVSIILNSSISGWLAGGGWWFLDLVTRGDFSGRFFLFAASTPKEFDLDSNRLLLAGIGIALFALAFLALERKKKV